MTRQLTPAQLAEWIARGAVIGPPAMLPTGTLSPPTPLGERGGKRRRPKPALRGKRVGGLAVSLPMPPSVNGYYTVGSGRKVLSTEGRRYRKAVAVALAAQGACHVAGRLKALVVVQFADNRACDLDNRLKSLLDAMQACGLFADDSQFDDLQIVRGDKAEAAGVTVCLTEIVMKALEG